MKKLALAVVVVLAAAVAFWSTFWAAPLPEGKPFEGPIPLASAPAEMTIRAIPTGVTHRSAAFAYRGGSFSDARDFSMTATLVTHPRGDVLIDTGFGEDVAAQLQLMPWWFRAITKYEFVKAAEATPSAILITHAHWDHVSGASAFKGVPIWVNAEEHRFIREGGWLTAVARSCTNPIEEFEFEGGPYLGFSKSHDVYGDGAIVVVPAAGHTPGSVIVFVTLPSMKRYAFVGDLVWQREGISEREERPWLQRTLGDADPAAVRETIVHMAALKARLPELEIVPAHDVRGF